MSDITFSTTADLSIAEIARAMTTIWSKVEYQSDLPAEVETAASYAQFCRGCNIDLAHSISARDGSGRVIGLAMLGIRGQRGWCGDFGLVPQWRGKGIGHRLMAAFVEEARSLGLHSLLLDLRQENAPAIKIYERAGFRTRRVVVGLRADSTELHLSSSTASAKSVDPWMTLHWYGEPLSPPPMWQRELPALLATDNTQGWVAERQGREQAFTLYKPQLAPGFSNILHLGISPEAEQGDLLTLLAAAMAKDKEATQVFGGLMPEDSQAAQWLINLGFRIRAHYLEMVLDL